MQRLKRLYKDEQGAALVEYTVLLGVMLVAVIGTIVALTRALARSHVAATAAPQPHPAADHPRVIEGEFVVVEPRSATPQR